MAQKSWEEGEKEKLGVGRNELDELDEEIRSREEGEIGSESREKGDLLPCSSPLHTGMFFKQMFVTTV